MGGDFIDRRRTPPLISYADNWSASYRQNIVPERIQSAANDSHESALTSAIHVK